MRDREGFMQEEVLSRFGRWTRGIHQVGKEEVCGTDRGKNTAKAVGAHITQPSGNCTRLKGVLGPRPGRCDEK